MRSPRATHLGMFFAVVLFALPVAGEAPLDQYEQFTGDDPEVTDAFTKLTWERLPIKPTPTTRTYASADSHCKNDSLPTVNRVPTVKELLTIVDEEPHDEYEVGTTTGTVYKALDQNAFNKSPTDAPYWSSTPTGGSATEVWAVDFRTGLMVPLDSGNVATKAYVRCVR